MSSQRTHNRNRRRNLRMEVASESADFEDVAQQATCSFLVKSLVGNHHGILIQ